jgi:pilus assembly protein CpaE
VGLSATEDPAILQHALQLRMAALLAPPIAEVALVGLVKRLSVHLAMHPASVGELGQIFAFMPAKGGVGASTIAANAALTFAQDPKLRVLMADFDVYSGLMGFQFNVEHDFSISHALKRSKNLDEETWQNLVKKVGNLDLLFSGAPALDDGISGAELEPVLDFARRSYSVVCADIADTFDERSTVVLREASKIFLVTTPDLPSLRLAHLKASCLGRLDWEDKARLIVNRTHGRMELTVPQIEETVGLPVCATMPCDYADVTRATKNAKASPKLAPSIQAFVAKLLDKKILEPKRSRFIERFALVSSRYTFK